MDQARTKNDPKINLKMDKKWPKNRPKTDQNRTKNGTENGTKNVPKMDKNESKMNIKMYLNKTKIWLKGVKIRIGDFNAWFCKVLVKKQHKNG